MSSVKHTEFENRAKDADDLLLRATQGDRGALEELYRMFSPQVYAFALATLKNVEDAKDVLQDCFVSLCCNSENYQPQGKAKSYIMTVTNNLCLMLLRKRKRNADLPEEDWMPQIEREELTPYEKALLRECLSSLDDLERQVIVLHVVSGYKYREIAALLHLPLSTVLSKYFRAQKKMQEKFK
ncbi:MAG: RNA polymerase sigma factor [Clostridia bacterium]|nr:RNA polymerase sigma factor [Clostridia bacterium]